MAIVACSSDSTTTHAGGGPAFEGVSWVVPDEHGNLVVGWKETPGATDYRVYISRIQGRELKTAPAVRTNTTSVVVTPDVLKDRYYVIVRAANVAGAEDTNTVEKSAIASPDTTPPQFGGATGATPSGNAGATVTWNPAQDDFTPPEAIVYDIFAGPTRTDLAHVAVSGPGDTSIALNQLGDPTQQFFFKVSARDIANNVSPDPTPPVIVSTQLGQDATPPTFAGCDTVVADDAKSATVTWKAATDNHSAQSALTYEVFVASKAGGEDFTAAPVVKVTNELSTQLTALTPGTQYFVVCKALDEAANIDPNTAEKAFTTPSDVTPPTFAGINNFTFDATNRVVSLQWAAATDDQTPAGQIIYDVYESKVSGTYDFTAPPRASSQPGALSVVVSNLASRSTLNWVVHARDLAGNHDINTSEKSGTTLTSFSLDVEDVFNRNCAVVGCHVSGTQTGGMNLAPDFAYNNIVNVSSNEARPMPRITPGDTSQSWLFHKINDQPPAVGLPMPAAETGNALSAIDKDIITSWILSNAPNN